MAVLQVGPPGSDRTHRPGRRHPLPAPVLCPTVVGNGVSVPVLQVVPPGSKAAGLDAGAFLLVQRPKEGLLAGLWEFPSQVVSVGGAGADGAGAAGSGGGGRDGERMGGGGSGSSSPAELQRQMTAYLSRLLDVRLQRPRESEQAAGEGEEEEAVAGGGAGIGCWEVVERRQLGSLVHVFSHIRWTMVVEKLVVRGELPAAAAGPGAAGPAAEAAVGSGSEEQPAMQWLSRKELEARGLSSSPGKVLKLLLKDGSAGKASITKFFKPVAAAGKA